MFTRIGQRLENWHDRLKRLLYKSLSAVLSVGVHHCFYRGKVPAFALCSLCSALCALFSVLCSLPSALCWLRSSLLSAVYVLLSALSSLLSDFSESCLGTQRHNSDHFV
jgi:hypothetical protein